MSEDEEEEQDKKLIQKEFLERLAEKFISNNIVNEEFGVPIRKNVVVTGEKEDEEYLYSGLASGSGSGLVKIRFLIKNQIEK